MQHYSWGDFLKVNPKWRVSPGFFFFKIHLQRGYFDNLSNYSVVFPQDLKIISRKGIIRKGLKKNLSTTVH